MTRNITKVTKIVINNKPYIIYRDREVEGMSKENGSFSHILRRLILSDLDGKWIGAINFFEDIITAFGQDKSIGSMFGFSEMLEFSFANLLTHLPIDIERITSIFERSLSCFNIEFGSIPDNYDREKDTYSIKLDGNLLNTAQRIVFKDGINRKSIKREILQILLNNLEENPSGYMKIEELESSIPILIKEVIFNLNLLEEEGTVKCTRQFSESNPIINVKITAKGVSELDTSNETLKEKASTVNNYFAPNIVTQTYGSNSPISINLGEITTVFENLKKEIEESEDIQDKNEVINILDELKTEVISKENPNKVQENLNKIKTVGGWVYDKIINNPYISGIIVDLLMRQTLHN